MPGLHWRELADWARLPACVLAGICCPARHLTGVENNKHRDLMNDAPRTTNSSAFWPLIPTVRFFDAFVNDLNTVERGKRIDRDGIARVFAQGMPLPGSMFALDIEGGTSRGHRPRLRRRRRRSALHAHPRHAGARALAGRRGAGAAAHVRSRWRAFLRRPALDARAATGHLRRARSHAGDRDRVRVLPGGSRSAGPTDCRNRRGARSRGGANTARRSTR